jgi:hypothetical protein
MAIAGKVEDLGRVVSGRVSVSESATHTHTHTRAKVCTLNQDNNGCMFMFLIRTHTIRGESYIGKHTCKNTCTT